MVMCSTRTWRTAGCCGWTRRPPRCCATSSVAGIPMSPAGPSVEQVTPTLGSRRPGRFQATGKKPPPYAEDTDKRGATAADAPSQPSRPAVTLSHRLSRPDSRSTSTKSPCDVGTVQRLTRHNVTFEPARPSDRDPAHAGCVHDEQRN